MLLLGQCKAWSWRWLSKCTYSLSPCRLNLWSRQRLKNEVKAMGSALSARQSLNPATQRKELASRLTSHRSAAATWVAVSSTSLYGATDGSPPGHPEHQSSLLPSTHAPGLLTSIVNQPIITTERALRCVSCLKTLQTLRSVAMQHAHLVSAKSKHARGIKAVTRAEGLTHRLQEKMDFVRWEYCHSRARL